MEYDNNHPKPQYVKHIVPTSLNVNSHNINGLPKDLFDVSPRGSLKLLRFYFLNCHRSGFHAFVYLFLKVTQRQWAEFSCCIIRHVVVSQKVT